MATSGLHRNCGTASHGAAYARAHSPPSPVSQHHHHHHLRPLPLSATADQGITQNNPPQTYHFPESTAQHDAGLGKEKPLPWPIGLLTSPISVSPRCPVPPPPTCPPSPRTPSFYKQPSVTSSAALLPARGGWLVHLRPSAVLPSLLHRCSRAVVAPTTRPAMGQRPATRDRKSSNSNRRRGGRKGIAG